MSLFDTSPRKNLSGLEKAYVQAKWACLCIAENITLSRSPGVEQTQRLDEILTAKVALVLEYPEIDFKE